MRISFSPASLHIGSRWARQNARLHIAHVAAGARGSCFEADLSDEELECEDRGIMVLLVKHVHLQNDGGAVNTISDQIIPTMFNRYLQVAIVETTNVHNTSKKYMPLIFVI